MRLKATDIRQVWDMVKPRISSLKKRFNQDWRIEDVYAACIMGRAVIYVDDNNFIIVHERTNEFNLKLELFVWVAYSEGSDSLDEYYPDVCEIAKSIGAEVITFSTKRKGFEKIAKDSHWKLRESVYEVRVA